MTASTARRIATGVLVLLAVLTAGAPAAGAAAPPTSMWAYYYIWFNVSSWNRSKSDYPLLGRYSSDEASFMRRHVQLAKQAGIDGFIVSWKSTPVLDRRLRLLVDVAAQEHFKLGIIYQGLDFERRPIPIERVDLDFSRFEQVFARSPVFHAFGKPVVVWSGTWEFSRREIARVTAAHRSKLRILASERNARDYVNKADLFDGDAYYWSSVNPRTFPGYQSKLDGMAAAVHAHGGMWVPPAAPGFDGRLIGRPTVVPRRGGDTLREQLDAAQSADPDLIGLISWNEFSENSDVEPSRRYGTQALRVLSGHQNGPAPLTATLGFLVFGLFTLYFLARRQRPGANV
jgi:hypothetical protein